MYLLKKLIFLGVIGTALYFMFSYHFIVVDKSLKMLKKSHLTMKYTFFSTKARSMDSILTIQELWDDGIGDLLLEEGKISEQDLDMYRAKMESEDEESD